MVIARNRCSSCSCWRLYGRIGLLLDGVSVALPIGERLYLLMMAIDNFSFTFLLAITYVLFGFYCDHKNVGRLPIPIGVLHTNRPTDRPLIVRNQGEWVF